MTEQIKVQKNGRKVHLSEKGSSTTRCGVWMKTQTSNYKVSEKTFVNCVKCNPEQKEINI